MPVPIVPRFPKPALPSASAETVRQSSLRLLANWSLTDPAPASLTADQVRQAIQAQRALLQPVEAAAFAVLIDRLFAFARTFGLANPDTTAATGFYRQALKDIPADLVAKAVERVCRGWKWGHKIPLPADLYGAVSDELTRRKKELAQLEQALLRLPRPEAEKERVGAGQIRALRLHLEHFANAHRMPGVSARPPQART